MPLLLTLIALDAVLLVHAGATGRLGSWGPLIMGLPLVGVLLYVMVELIPERMAGAQVRQVERDLARRPVPVRCGCLGRGRSAR
ncbi:MAG: hypothetical protein QOI12_4100 [Alphaproteobacteria bacterium]|nr:hypothetical protein [Alphaproteobacteria bacterium]